MKKCILILPILIFGCGTPPHPDIGETCPAPRGLTISNIDSVTTWINAMPKPVSLPCFLESLPRPMYYNATISTFSAQPSQGSKSPRIFLFINKLILTIVPDEETTLKLDPITKELTETWDANGYQLLEMSYEVENSFPLQSVKAELKFPVTKELLKSSPYDQIDFTDTASNCSICHAGEILIENINGVPVYKSDILRNNRSNEISLQQMIKEYETCNPETNQQEQYRCNMLDSIYGHGELIWRSFPIDLPTFQ